MPSRAKEVRKGMVVDFNGSLHKVANLFHGTPGNLRAFIQMDLKDLKTGKTVSKKFGVDDQIEIAYLENKTMEYLYNDGTNFVFMDLQTYEQHNLPAEMVEDAVQYIKENTEVKIVYHDSTPISVELPSAVTLKVEFTEPGIKGDSVNNVYKPATLETGLEVKVPLYIEIGEFVKVDTRTGEFLERTKGP